MLAMAQVIKRDLPTWEHVLIREGSQWARYTMPRERLGAERAIADGKNLFRFLRASRWLPFPDATDEGEV